ncbi:39S ribosomal protein L2, mitochondrial-like [Ceratina calcarata]|uniref:39S ribosomal protein L2, mitochondrial-like n=1 Tax=Ceratina calcarata TaxID=156304 RepID=A0AAJ7JE98_9HYME|nr:39S ribosomal protein L2, mitochondrial-like [Ceratina calcarata]
MPSSDARWIQNEDGTCVAVRPITTSAMSLISRVFAKQVVESCCKIASVSCQTQQIRNKWKLVKVPEPGLQGKSFRRIVHFKDEYTIEPLEVTNLGGRDPVTGRVVVQGIGGGVKHKYHWIQWLREGPTDLDVPPREDRVLQIFKDGCRTAHVALIGSGDQLRYILATENMKIGDIIRTHQGIPKNPVRVFEGDAYPLGALPRGTSVHCVEKYPNTGGCLIHAAGTCGVIMRRDGPDRVIVKMPSKREFSLHETCMATVGKLSNPQHASTPIPNTQKWRELGNRPRSGLWQRKGGRHGRKIRPLPPVQKVGTGIDKSVSPIVLELNSSKLN